MGEKIKDLKMKDKYILKAQLTEDDSSERLLEIAKEQGLVLPHPALGIFGTPLFSVETKNGNDVRLSKEGTEKALQTIKHTQINPNHERDTDQAKKHIFGHTIHAELQEDGQVFMAFVFYKDIFSVEFEQAKELMKQGKLFVSWEITADIDTQEELADGSRRINDFSFLGTGLLYDVAPAYPEAVVNETAAKIPANDPELMFAKQLIAQIDEVPNMERIFIITSTDDAHWHVAEINLDGNGETIDIFGEDLDVHTHPIVNFQIQEADAHAHRITYEIWASIKQTLKSKYNVDLKFDPSNVGDIKQGGINSMDEKQKKIVAELREKFGDLAKDYSDEDLLESTKVAELEQAQKDAEEKSELKKAQTRIVELETKVAELEGTIEAKGSEIEAVRVDAEKIGKLKVELADNPYVKDFNNEDYLNEDKVEEAKRKHGLDKKEADLKAREEAVKEKEIKTAAQIKQEQLEADKKNGNDDNKTEDTYASKVEESIIKLRKQNK